MSGRITEFEAGGRSAWVWSPAGSVPGPLPVVLIAAGGEMKDEICGVMDLVQPRFGSGCGPFLAAGAGPVDWERDYTPWPAPPLQGRQLTGGADAWLRFLCGTLLPEIRGRFSARTDEAGTAVAGYSLGGLFALFAFLSGAGFGRAASISGSLWYDGWSAWMRDRPVPSGGRCYLSLGTAEERTRNARLAAVGGATRLTADTLASRLGPDSVRLQWNPGGHFADEDRRFADALLWLMQP